MRRRDFIKASAAIGLAASVAGDLLEQAEELQKAGRALRVRLLSRLFGPLTWTPV